MFNLNINYNSMFIRSNILALQKFVLPCKSRAKNFSHAKPWRDEQYIFRSLSFKHRELISPTYCDLKRRSDNIKRQMFSTNNINVTRPQNYDYFLILDFEATCDSPLTPKPQEIIEFPVLKLNAKTFDIESTFHTYVQPKINKELSSFCIELTGIIQDQIDKEPHLDEVLQKFRLWYDQENLSNPTVKSIFVTCGDWDLYTMLPEQCKYFNIALPEYFKKWINLKKSYVDATSTWPKDLTSMTLGLGLCPIGRLHSGIDDCKNMAAIMKRLAERGHIFNQSGSLT